MTHIENIAHILQNGITHSTSLHANSAFVPIGDGSLITTRNNILLANNKRLGDYIPFYFGSRTPMLYVVQKGFNMVAPTPPDKIVYCISSVQKIIDLQLDFMFTDGHAVDSFTTQYNASDIQNINNILDKSAIDAKYWTDENDLDKKRRKEAEFLVFGDIPLEAVLYYVTYNENAKNFIVNLGADAAKIGVRPEFYF